MAGMNISNYGLSPDRQLQMAKLQLQQQLASGKKINSAADDPSGLAISEKMQASINQMLASTFNWDSEISMNQTQDGYLSSQGDMVQRIHDLTVKASNGTYSDSERAGMQAEINQIVEEMNRYSESANFNGNKLGLPSAADLGLDKIDISTLDGANSATKSARTAVSEIASRRGTVGSRQKALQHRINNEYTSLQNLQSAQSTIRDTDYATATTALTSANVASSFSSAMFAQANLNAGTILSLLG
jgi:flagellin